MRLLRACVAFALITAALSLLDSAGACSCWTNITEQAEFDAVAYVVAARVERVERHPEGWVRTITLRVFRRWKGGEQRELLITGDTCTPDMRVGQAWIAFVYKGPTGRLSTNLCGNTRRYWPWNRWTKIAGAEGKGI